MYAIWKAKVPNLQFKQGYPRIFLPNVDIANYLTIRDSLQRMNAGFLKKYL